ncbi:hypothetical protein HYW42_02680 [Candidatus Daviesbacteria bacterium]|nr:hypothetical protein [Candidatus Daviesbacteria bacterium]
MNNLIKLVKKPVAITFILSIALLWPLFVAPYFTHHDDVQVIRLYEMDKCIKDLQIPCRWVPDLGGQYGYPLFNYYAPLPYYVGEIFFLLTNNLILSMKVMFVIPFIASFIFMYLLAKKFWGELGASVSALFYSYAPYHALDFYVRGAMGELWALMAFPAIFYSLFKLFEKKSIGNILFLTLSFSVLLLSHNLSTMIFIPFVAIFTIFLYLFKRDNFFVLSILASFTLAIVLSSFYFIPVIAEKDFVHVDTTTYGYFHYTEHFKGFKKLFLDRSWGWGQSVREVPGGERDGISFQIGWVHVLAWVISLFVAKRLWSSKTNKLAVATIILTTIGIMFAIFMVNPRSEPIWKAIPPLEFLQFPWRFLILITFFISFLSGSIFLLTRSKKIWLLLMVAVALFNFSYFRPEKFIYTSNQELLQGSNWNKQIMRSIFDFLPIYAKEPPATLAESNYQILTGEASIKDFNKGTNWFNFNADVKTHTILRLSQYYFPEWIIKIDGQVANIEYKNNTLGLMTLILGEGEYRIEGRLFDTPVRILSNWLSLIGFVVILILFPLQFKRIQIWIMYYLKRAG